MNRSRWLMVWVLAFSLGLNVMLVTMGVMNHNKADAQQTSQTAATQWTYTILFPLDDPELKLTPEQTQKLRELRTRLDRDELQLNVQTADRVARWYQYLLTGNLTQEEIAPYIAESQQGSHDLMMRLVNSMNYHRAVLTPEQNRILTERLRTKFKELGVHSQNRLSNNKKRLTEEHGEAFVRAIVGTTSGTTEAKK